MSNENVLSLFANPKFPRRVLEWLVAAIAVLGPLAVVAHAFATSADAAVRAHLVLQGFEVIAATLVAAVAAGVLHSLANAMESELTGAGPRYAAA